MGGPHDEQRKRAGLEQTLQDCDSVSACIYYLIYLNQLDGWLVASILQLWNW
jgi:hypothetical protein